MTKFVNTLTIVVASYTIGVLNEKYAPGDPMDKGFVAEGDWIALFALFVVLTLGVMASRSGDTPGDK
jgi:hypothetical protein